MFEEGKDSDVVTNGGPLVQVYNEHYLYTQAIVTYRSRAKVSVKDISESCP